MAQGITFFKEYFDYMDDMTPEQYCKFMRMIRDLRFDGIDTLPEDVEDKVVRLAWRAVRPVVQKSTRNAKNYGDRKNKTEKEEEPQDDSQPIPKCDLDDTPYFSTENELLAYVLRTDEDSGKEAAMETLKAVCDRSQIDFKKMKKEFLETRDRFLSYR